jgi:methylmalonyl-CoA/ethylmalonyl-CoA epimerase
LTNLASIGRFHHIGIATHDLDGALRAYGDIGYEPGPPFFDTADAVKIVFLSKPGCPTVELISPTNESSPVAKWILRRGAGVYHSCYEVLHLETAVAELRKLQWIPATNTRAAPAMDGKNIVFLFHPAVGLLELVEGVTAS